MGWQAPTFQPFVSGYLFIPLETFTGKFRHSLSLFLSLKKNVGKQLCISWAETRVMVLSGPHHDGSSSECVYGIAVLFTEASELQW